MYTESPLWQLSKWRAAALAVVLITTAAVRGDGQETPRQGTYHGRWDVAGKAQKIELGTSHTVTVVKFQGAVGL